MRNQKSIIALPIVLSGILISVAFAESPTTAGKIKKVTVYRGQALVTRTINVDIPPGTSELIVRNLPAKIVSESIYAQTQDGTKVLSVR